MRRQRVTWDDGRRMSPSTYVWKGRLLTCNRWLLESADGRRACELELNGKGCTADFLLFDPDGHGSILSFSSLGAYDLAYRRIYAGDVDACRRDVLAWVNEWQPPLAGVDGGVLLSLDQWGNDVAV